MNGKTTVNPAALAALAGGDLENFIAASTPGGIEAQEKRGQTDLVNSTNMPLELSPGKEAFEALGFTFGKPIDEIFQEATLPDGWSRAATDHDMHSDILDEKGRRRVSVFYKAAFYDRRADARLISRFCVEYTYPDGENGPVTIVALDRKSGEHVRVFGKSESDDWEARNGHSNAAHAWLTAEYPDHRDPTAYW